MQTRVAVVTGCTGQDGSYLAELLLEKDYKVYALKRRNSSNSLGCCVHLAGKPNFEIVEGDLADGSSLSRLCSTVRPMEFYNLAAQSHVWTSFQQPQYTLEATGAGVLNCLEAIRLSGIHTRFFQASTSEMFGGLHGEAKVNESPSFFHPRSPYGCAKMYGYWITVNYRESYNMFACNGIAFNHESPRRGVNFVTRKITQYIARIITGTNKDQKLLLGNLSAKRDWGHAKDYVKGMYLMMQHSKPDDFVLATGKTRSVEEFLQTAADLYHIDWHDYVHIDPTLYRPAEVDVLLGDPSKAERELGWRREWDFTALVADMVDSDIDAIRKKEKLM